MKIPRWLWIPLLPLCLVLVGPLVLAKKTSIPSSAPKRKSWRESLANPEWESARPRGETTRRSGLAYRWKPGEENESSFEFCQRVRLDPNPDFVASMQKGGIALSGGESQEVESSYEATLLCRVYAVEEDRAWVGFEFSRFRVDLQVMGQRPESNALEKMASAMAGEAILEVDSLGHVHTLYLPEDFPAQQANYLRTFSGLLQSQLPPESQSSWSLPETDGKGAYLAEYSLHGTADSPVVEVHKRKRYQRHFVGAALDSLPMNIPEGTMEGGGTARFDSSIGRLIGLEVAERMGVKSAQFPYEMEITEVAHVRLLSSRKEEAWALSMAALRKMLRGYRAFPTFEPESLSKLAEEAEERRRKARVAQRKLSEVIGELMGVEPERRAPTFRLLVDLLRFRPDAVQEAQVWLKGADLELAAQLLNALGRAGTPECQAVAAEVLRDGAAPSLLRETALWALTESAHPSPETISTFRTLCAGSDSLSTVATESFGILADRLGEAGNGEQADEVASDLAERLSSKPPPEECARILLGLGNAARPSSVSLLRDFATDPCEEVRAAAVTALRRFDSKESLDALSQSLRSDPSDGVRRAALGALAHHPGESTESEIERALFQDPDKGVRMKALAFFAGRSQRSSQSVQELLLHTVGSDPSEEVRTAARSYLEGK